MLFRSHSGCLIAGSPPPTGHDSEHSQTVLAAALQVIAAKSPEWCLQNPEDFSNLTKDQLGLLVNIALLVANLFGGGGVWLTLLKWLLPAVLDWLSQVTQSTAYGALPINWNQLAVEGERIGRSAT